jgi:hypothetical protein
MTHLTGDDRIEASESFQSLLAEHVSVRSGTGAYDHLRSVTVYNAETQKVVAYHLERSRDRIPKDDDLGMDPLTPEDASLVLPMDRTHALPAPQAFGEHAENDWGWVTKREEEERENAVPVISSEEGNASEDSRETDGKHHTEVFLHTQRHVHQESQQHPRTSAGEERRETTEDDPKTRQDHVERRRLPVASPNGAREERPRTRCTDHGTADHGPSKTEVGASEDGAPWAEDRPSTVPVRYDSGRLESHRRVSSGSDGGASRSLVENAQTGDTLPQPAPLRAAHTSRAPSKTIFPRGSRPELWATERERADKSEDRRPDHESTTVVRRPPAVVSPRTATATGGGRPRSSLEEAPFDALRNRAMRQEDPLGDHEITRAEWEVREHPDPLEVSAHPRESIVVPAHAGTRAPASAGATVMRGCLMYFPVSEQVRREESEPLTPEITSAGNAPVHAESIAENTRSVPAAFSSLLSSPTRRLHPETMDVRPSAQDVPERELSRDPARSGATTDQRNAQPSPKTHEREEEIRYSVRDTFEETSKKGTTGEVTVKYEIVVTDTDISFPTSRRTHGSASESAHHRTTPLPPLPSSRSAERTPLASPERMHGVRWRAPNPSSTPQVSQRTPPSSDSTFHTVHATPP